MALIHKKIRSLCRKNNVEVYFLNSYFYALFAEQNDQSKETIILTFNHDEESGKYIMIDQQHIDKLKNQFFVYTYYLLYGLEQLGVIKIEGDLNDFTEKFI